MARRTATSYRAGKAAAGAAPEDQPEAPEAAAPAAQGQGPPFLDTLVITTPVLLVGAMKSSPAGFIPFSLNADPPFDIMAGLEQAKLIPEAVGRFNRIHSPDKLWMHDEWSNIWRKIKYSDELKKREERERLERMFAPSSV